MKTLIVLISIIWLLASCQSEHCYNFISTATTTVNTQTTTEKDTSIYCGITEDEAGTMAASMRKNYKIGNTTIMVTVTYNER